MATYRQIHVKIWSSPDVQKLGSKSKFIFIYLFSNTHRNEAALYRITPKTISNETDLPIDEVISSLSELSDDSLIKWDQENNIVWVINAIRYQKLSPNEVIGIKKNLATIDHEYVNELLTYYQDVFSTYEVPSKELSSNSEVPPGKGKGSDKDKGNDKKDKPPTPLKTKYAEFVTMTKEEYQKLIDQFGEEKTKDFIERLNLYKGSKGKSYKSDYMTILNWDRKDSEKGGQAHASPGSRDRPNVSEDDDIFAPSEQYEHLIKRPKATTQVPEVP